MILPARKIAAMIGAASEDRTPISVLLTDSRNLETPENTVFFALRTAGNDGHKYIPDLISKGVRFFVVAEDCGIHAGVEFWRVGNVLDALQKIAEKVREKLPALRVVGITGSRGKTVVKEMLNKLLCNEFVISRSPRSYNSQIGVPLSIWGLDYDTTLGIFEAGISEKGEMARLRNMIQPTIGIFTSLTDEHSDGFSSMEEKALEKAKLFEGCEDIFYPQGDIFIANALSSLNAALHPVEGESEELAVAVAQFIAKKNVEADAIKGLANKISTRIDVCETLKGCLIVYDGFSTDLASISAAINYAKRHASIGKPITLVLGNSNAIDSSELDAMLKAKGISRLIAVDSPQEFTGKYSISDFNDEVILVCGPLADGYEEIKVHLEAPRHETIMEVDLGAIAKNFNYYRSLLPPTTGLIAMVKAQGYGVGALELSKTLQNQGASYLAVAVIDEGAELRRGGISMPIIVMNPITTNYKALFDNRLEPSVFSIRELDQLIDNAKRLGIKEYPIHIKLDTGMHRVGFLEDEIPHLLDVLKKQDYVKVSTIFSHLATADCLDEDEYTLGQLQTFDRMSLQIIDGLGYGVKRHILNTAGMMRYPQYHYDFARLGIGLYGISPLPSGKENLEIVAQLFTRIISIKHWNPGITIGYGRRGKISKPSIIATIPIGYADGLDRHFSNGKASFIVNGVECPVVGNICMDQCMIDVTSANAVIGDEVEIFGKRAPIERLSAALDTIPYEILTSVSPRVKRIYFRE